MTDLEKIRDTVISEGWQLLMIDVEAKLQALTEAMTNPKNTLDEMRVAQGRIFGYRELLGLPVMIELALKEKEDDKELADVEIDPI